MTFLFIVKFNGASLRPLISRFTPNAICSSVALKKCKTVECQKHPKDTHAVYIDDLSEAEAVDLKNQLLIDSNQRQLPQPFHERTGHIYPKENSLLQKKLLELENFTKNNKMKINIDKTHIIVFNKSRKYDFPPEFCFENGQLLDTVEEVKLLGVQLTSNLSWSLHVKMVFKKAMTRMWLLRRMKLLNLTILP